MYKRVLLSIGLFITAAAVAESIPTISFNSPTAANSPSMPITAPTAPTISGKAYVLMDSSTGKILASQNAEQRLPPASLTKMMTSYIVSEAIRQGRIKLDDQVFISEKAWRTGGSKMFVKVNDRVPVRDLMQGIIVDSGNDACVAMAEHIAGTEEAFASLMNQAANALGMRGTHFTDSTGLPNPNHFTTAHDMAILGRALIKNFPEDYKWYSQKWFTYNGIKQPNRNRLLWRDPAVDGIKTGHTDEAGFCLVSSAEKNGTRLISVVMGSPTDNARAEDSQRLLNYGFRFFETHRVYTAGTVLKKGRVWYGKEPEIPLGVLENVNVTVIPGQYPNLKINIILDTPLKAPITKGKIVGKINVDINGQTANSFPLVALQDDPKGGFFTYLVDSINLFIKRLFHKTI